jgi:hypothetical protein
VFRIRNIFNLKTQPKLPSLMLPARRDTPLKKTAFAVAVALLAVLMVLPVVRSVNLSAGKPITIDRTQYADSAPLPPPIPPKPPSANANILVADSAPLPPPIPPKPPSINANTLVADSSPLPPPIPPKPPESQVLA